MQPAGVEGTTVARALGLPSFEVAFRLAITPPFGTLEPPRACLLETAGGAMADIAFRAEPAQGGFKPSSASPVREHETWPRR